MIVKEVNVNQTINFKRREIMNRKIKKAISIILVSLFLFSACYTNIFAQKSLFAEKLNEDSVKVSATADSPISIVKSEGSDDNIFDGLLTLKTTKYSIKHDYSQICKVNVTNNGNRALEYYLAIENDYEDLSMNFIKSGSKASPFIIQPKETQEVELAIFAQNAEKTEYKFPIYAYIIENNEEYCDAANVVNVVCESASMNFSMKNVSNDEHTLSQTIELTNNGEYISDVTLSIKGDAEEYVSINPIVQNYQMKRNDSIKIKLRPDLTKMKDKKITSVLGKLEVSGCGKKQYFNINFDSKGQEIASMTIGELVKLQNQKSTRSSSSRAYNMGSFTYDVKGSQCTNRGKVTTDYYLDDIIEMSHKNTRAISSDDLHLFLTSRMYGGSYVDRTTTNYDYYLNGALVATSQNSGLTEVSVVELPTDNLKFGEVNTIVRDYDTDPGTHFVTAETQITLTVPADARISYIGSPETLDDVRSLPDGAIYSENIFSTSDKVYIGEKTNINFNIYNRGSAAGTFDINVSDGKNIIYSETSHEMNAFSSDTISFDWIPENPTSQITVSLTNTSGVDERDISNNTATKEITVKEHVAPTFESISDVNVTYGEDVILSADVRNADDVTNVAFFVDNKLVEGTIKSGVKNSNTRYFITASDYNIGEHDIKVVITYSTDKTKTAEISKTATLWVEDKDWEIPTIETINPSIVLFGSSEYIDVYISNNNDVKRINYYIDGKESSSYIADDLLAGEHELRIVVTYETSPGVMASVEKTQKLTVLSKQESSFTFTLDETFNNPEFRLYNYYSENYYDWDYVDISEEDGVYTLPLSKDMYNKPQDYVLYVSSDAGFLFIPLNSKTHNIKLSDCKKLSYVQKDGVEINSVYVQNVNDKVLSSISISREKSVYLLPGMYTFNIYYSYKGNSFSKYINIDISDNDVEIDLISNFKEYTLNFADEVDTVNARMYYKTSWGYYDYDSMYTNFDEKTRKHTAFFTDEDSLARFNSSEDVFFLVWTNDAVYKCAVKSKGKSSEDTVINLSKSDLKKLTLVVDDPETIKVQEVEIQESEFYTTLYSDVIYLPEDNYTIGVTCSFNEKAIIQKSYRVELNKDQELKLDNDLSSLIVTWSNAYNKSNVDISAYGRNNHYFSANISSGEKVSAQKDIYDIDIKLRRNNSYFGIYSYSVDLLSTDAILNIGDSFSGKISNTFDGNYSGKSYIRIELDDLKDENANILSYFNSNSEEDNLKGYVIFTSTENSKEAYKVPVSLDSIYSFSIELPNETGSFNVSIELSTDNTMEPEEPITPEDPCKNGHEWGEWKYNNDAKFFREGTCTRKCINCDETETKIAEGTAGWHDYVCGGNHSWVTVAVIVSIAVIVKIVLHYTFWYIPWM